MASTASSRNLATERQPELAWLRQEFNLPENEFKRIYDLHAGYLPECRAMCAKIDANNSHIQELLRSSNNVTPEIEGALAESAKLRAECQTMMLKHFFDVSRTMPESEGRRYLAWVQEKAFGPNYEMHAMNSPSQK